MYRFAKITNMFSKKIEIKYIELGIEPNIYTPIMLEETDILPIPGDRFIFDKNCYEIVRRILGFEKNKLIVIVKQVKNWLAP